jgi:glycosyltransferase involved in cell wall biosynthesis
LLGSLEELRIPNGTDYEILIVDNNSTDQTRETVHEFIKRKKIPLYYFFEGDQGSSYARNRGISEAKGSVIAFLDDDEIVDENWLFSLHEGFDRFECSGIGGRVIAKWAFSPPNWYTIKGPFRIVGPTAGHDLGDAYAEYSLETRLPVTANLAIKKHCFTQYGYFRTDMGPVGNDYIMGEDMEFCLRLIKGGERIIYSPKAVVYNMVHEDRVTKPSCKSYHFRFGRIQAELLKFKDGTRTLDGIPIFLFREYFEALISLISAALFGNKQATFFYRLKLSRISGRIYQHFLENHQGNPKNFIRT